MNSNSVIGSVGSVLLALVSFILILYLAYFATKKMGKRMSFRGVRNKNIKIVESVSVGQNKALMIVETAGKTLLVGVTQNQITLISELDGSMLDRSGDDHQGGSGGGMEFSRAFKTVLEQKIGKKLTKTKENKDDSGKE
ncbi:MAG: flagellar biosynthetic protein FliO [Porcipelethomonas sp.]